MSLDARSVSARTTICQLRTCLAAIRCIAANRYAKCRRDRVISRVRCALYALAFLGSDSPAMAEQQQWFAGKTDYQNFGLALASDTEAYAGHASKARELTKRAVDSAIRADAKKLEGYGRLLPLSGRPLTAILRRRGSQRHRL